MSSVEARRIAPRLLRLVPLVAALVVVIGVGAPATPAQAGSCTHRTGVWHGPDPYGNVYSQDWVCGNRGNINVYKYRDTGTVTGTLYSTRSWFVCYDLGLFHAGGNNVWYKTQGDQALPPWQGDRAWGYVPAVNVWTSVDPWYGMAHC
jgi:hypothetical protein